MQAGAMAYNDKKFAQAINKLKNTHKLNWSKIVENIYGTGQTAPSQQASPSQQTNPSQQNSLAKDAMSPKGSMPTSPPSAEAQAAQGQQQQAQQPQNPQQGQMQSQQQQSQPQGLDPQLAQLIQQGNELLKNFRGNRG